MIKENATVLRRLTIFADLCLMVASFFLGYLLRNKIYNIYPLSVYAETLPILLFIWVGLLNFFGMYRSFRTSKIPKALFIILKTVFFGFVVFSSFIYLFKIYAINRTFIILVFFFAAIFLGIEKVWLILFFKYARKKGLNYSSILIIGTGQRAQHFINLVNKHPEWGYKIIGLVDEDITKVGQAINGYNVIGSFKDVPDIIHNNVVDEVIFVVPRLWLGNIEEIMCLCENEGLKIHLAVDFFKLKFSKLKQTELDGFPLLTFESTPDKLWQLLIKRMVDIVASGVGLLILTPLFTLVAIMIKAASKGPVFFRQERCSLNGRKFTLYKFRTMFEDAETKLNGLLLHNEMKGPVFKMTNDPRLAGAGKFLRKLSIDELPQLWNVFKGDMSLVGPRPPIPEEVKHYDNWQRRRLSMRPGITCLWQVNGRNKITDFNEWAKLDLEYIDNWSFWLDCKILLKTTFVVLFGIGVK